MAGLETGETTGSLVVLYEGLHVSHSHSVIRRGSMGHGRPARPPEG